MSLAPHEIAEAMQHYAEVKAATLATLQERPVVTRATKYNADTAVDVTSSTKVVHFIRHGQGHHNVFGAEWALAGKLGNAYSDVGCPQDAELTVLGLSQAAALQPVLKDVLSSTPASISSSSVLVLVSPMRRAIQTALAAIEGESSLDQVYALELLHEQAGLHVCDKRLTKSELKTYFPKVNFDWIETEDDPLWGDGSKRESPESVLRRSYAFLMWLRERPEKQIIVASHSAFLCVTFACILKFGDDVPQDGLNGWFRTGEMRSVMLDWD